MSKTANCPLSSENKNKQRKGERGTHFSSTEARHSHESKPRQMGTGRPRQAVGHSTLQSVPQTERKGVDVGPHWVWKTSRVQATREGVLGEAVETGTVSVPMPACALGSTLTPNLVSRQPL